MTSGPARAKWQEVLASSDRRDAIDAGVRVALPISLAAAVADLAAAEQQCCSFMTFTLTFTASALELTVRAPEAAAGLLAELFGPIGLPAAPDRGGRPSHPAGPGALTEPGTGQPNHRLAP